MAPKHPVRDTQVELTSRHVFNIKCAGELSHQVRLAEMCPLTLIVSLNIRSSFSCQQILSSLLMHKAA